MNNTFYGGPKGKDFKIRKIFDSKASLMEDLNKNWISDVNVGDYVMVSYGLASEIVDSEYEDWAETYTYTAENGDNFSVEVRFKGKECEFICKSALDNCYTLDGEAIVNSLPTNSNPKENLRDRLANDVVKVTFKGKIGGLGNGTNFFPYGCKAKWINIDSSWTTYQINSQCFNNLSKLKLINLNNNILKIGDNAFSNCTSLEELVFADSLREIGSSAFENCTGLKSIRFLGENADNVKIAGNAFSRCANVSSLVMSWGEKVYETTIELPVDRILGDAANLGRLRHSDQSVQLEAFNNSGFYGLPTNSANPDSWACDVNQDGHIDVQDKDILWNEQFPNNISKLLKNDNGWYYYNTKSKEEVIWAYDRISITGLVNLSDYNCSIGVPNSFNGNIIYAEPAGGNNLCIYSDFIPTDESVPVVLRFFKKKLYTSPTSNAVSISSVSDTYPWGLNIDEGRVIIVYDDNTNKFYNFDNIEPSYYLLSPNDYIENKNKDGARPYYNGTLWEKIYKEKQSADPLFVNSLDDWGIEQIFLNEDYGLGYRLITSLVGETVDIDFGSLDIEVEEVAPTGSFTGAGTGSMRFDTENGTHKILDLNLDFQVPDNVEFFFGTEISDYQDGRYREVIDDTGVQIQFSESLYNKIQKGDYYVEKFTGFIYEVKEKLIGNFVNLLFKASLSRTPRITLNENVITPFVEVGNNQYEYNDPTITEVMDVNNQYIESYSIGLPKMPVIDENIEVVIRNEENPIVGGSFKITDSETLSMSIVMPPPSGFNTIGYREVTTIPTNEELNTWYPNVDIGDMVTVKVDNPTNIENNGYYWCYKVGSIWTTVMVTGDLEKIIKNSYYESTISNASSNDDTLSTYSVNYLNRLSWKSLDSSSN